MRRFTIVVLIICTLSILLFLYMEHDTKKFIKTISDPVSTTDQRNAPPEEKAEPLSIEETPLVDTQDSQEIVDEGTTPTHVHQTDHTHPHDHTADTHIRVDTSDNLESPPTSLALETESQAENDLKAERPKPLETLKKKLIEEHGDIPLVHTYIELRRKELNRESMTMEEVSTLWDAIMVFNPTPANKKTYELIKSLSSQADPGSFQIIYDPKKIGTKKPAQVR